MAHRRSKSWLAERYGVTPRTIENWRKRKLLPEPLKLGTAIQARVRWSDEDVAVLDANLAALSQDRRAA